MDVFNRYAPFIQDTIYEHGWQSLRGVQVAAGEAIFGTDQNVLLSASTASGKTEAAFYPILTLMAEDPPASVGALYLAPLKALINDQFDRLNEVCAQGDIPVWHWHGDVSQSHKRKLMKHPSGILQITPESLEAMLLHRHAAIPALFGDLRFIVIDELHALMRGDRGGQTLCLIERLSRMAGVNPRRIGLSATIGDPKQAAEFLSAGTGKGTVVPNIGASGQTWRLSMEHFFNSGPQASQRGLRMPAFARNPHAVDGETRPLLEQTEATLTGETQLKSSMESPFESPFERQDKPLIGPLAQSEPASDTAPQAADPGIGYIFEHTRGRKCLVFCNSREEAEAVTTTLRQYCEVRHEADRFLIHHGNLSAPIRQSAEEEMKDENSCMTTVTTATLELGIDIGRLERAFQIDAPFTVSSFLQRMGRTGRRDQPQEMWFVMREDPPQSREMAPDIIPWKLIQGIALIQLYVESRWVEPPRLDGLPYSLLYHQTMSTLASGGEMTPAQLASQVLSLAVFKRVTQDDYRILLRHLIGIDHIETTERGGLIVGVAGERITSNFKFYAVFQENEEYSVRSESQEIGTLVAPPPAGEKIAIAGHVWVVDEVDRKRHIVYCTMVKGKVPAYFGDVPGDINTVILERMRQVLLEPPEATYPYLMRNAAARLQQARVDAAVMGLADQPLRHLGGNMWALFPWLGTYAFLALKRLLLLRCAPSLGLKGLEAFSPYYMTFTMDTNAQAFYAAVTQAARELTDPLTLMYPDEIPDFNKYDRFLPPELVRKGFACGVLDLNGMRERVRQWERFVRKP
ncbi:ATP-dependent helicase [Bifidobacterium thermophilum]|uniref:ATP-dependent helicase n=2 Tax=Bifidobacterium thermophilum TaxID=33905 RepID=A0A2N3QKQ8_9BIFI|nr:ATP-dependent helicase [Bifidobacterium thermophilum]